MMNMYGELRMYELDYQPDRLNWNEYFERYRQSKEYVYGICPQCLKNKEKKSIRQASLLLGLTEDGAQKRLKSILKKLRKCLQE